MASTRSGFKRYDNDYGSIEWYYTMDMPLRQPQIDKVWDELVAYSQHRPALDVILSRLDDLTHDGYGSFAFQFPEDVWEETDATLSQWNEELIDAMNSTDWMSSWSWFNSVTEEGIDELIDNQGYDIDEVFSMYADSVLDMGYTLTETECQDIFNHPANHNQMSDDDIRKSLLPYSLKGRDIEYAKELETA